MTEGGENQNPEKSVWLPTKPQNIPGPTINPQTSHAEFPSLKNRSRRTTVPRRTTRPGYAGTTKNLQVVLNAPSHPQLPPQRNPYLRVRIKRVSVKPGLTELDNSLLNAVTGYFPKIFQLII